MNIKKILIILTSVALFLNQAAYTIYAQTPTPTPFLFRSESKIWRTIVGNVPGTKGPREEIVIWAEKIINELKLTNCGNRYNRMLANITNDGSYYATKRTAERCIESDETGIYHSTYLIIDAYNLTGFKGFTTTNYGSVARLITAWKAFSSTSDEYIFLDYQSNKKLLVSVEPGNVIFFQRKAFELSFIDHVAIINDIKIDSIGNGYFTTYDANYTKTFMGPYTVTDYNIQGAPTGTIVVGFGGIANTSGLPSGGPTPTPGGPGPSVSPPPSSGVVCPIPGGKITCGPSKPVFTSYSACNQGHCAGDYCPGGVCPSYCFSAPGTAYAIDIPGTPLQDVFLPEITIRGDTRTHPLTCTYVGFVPGTLNPQQIITQFDCRDTINNNRVWLQFHHIRAGTYPGSSGPFKSGDPVAGKVDPDTNSPSPFPHVHVQIGINGGCGSDISGCVAADQYLQCSRG